ncbi:hypothetical protein B0H13DRAFT_2351632 [Mycena leptocephala]|nr:hypothetical protein B0H13DRAFT_2351632 [Mycena leptocephala]
MLPHTRDTALSPFLVRCVAPPAAPAHPTIVRDRPPRSSPTRALRPSAAAYPPQCAARAPSRISNIAQQLRRPFFIADAALKSSFLLFPPHPSAHLSFIDLAIAPRTPGPILAQYHVVSSTARTPSRVALLLLTFLSPCAALPILSHLPYPPA